MSMKCTVIVLRGRGRDDRTFVEIRVVWCLLVHDGYHVIILALEDLHFDHEQRSPHNHSKAIKMSNVSLLQA